MNTLICPYCNVRIPQTEIQEGWCESCGKRIPRWAMKADNTVAKYGSTVSDASRSIKNEAIAILIAELNDERNHIRRDAAVKLGKMGEQARSALPELTKLLDDQYKLVRSAAQEAIARIEGRVSLEETDQPRQGSDGTGTRLEPNAAIGTFLQFLGYCLQFAAIIYLLTIMVFGKRPSGLDLGLAAATISTGVSIIRQGKKRAARLAEAVLQTDKRAPILLLRSFADDELMIREHKGGPALWPQTNTSFEEILAELLSQYGPTIAIGRPGEQLPPPGFARMWVPNEQWQSKVTELLAQCQKVVMIMGSTAGLAWEVDQLFTANMPDKVVLLIPPIGESAGRQRWEAVRSMFRGNLPPYEGYEIAVTFDANWKSRVERFSLKRFNATRDDKAYRAVIDAIMKPPSTAGQQENDSLILQAIKPLIEELHDQREHVRWAAAKKLASMGSKAKGAIPALIPLLNDNYRTVRQAALEAIESIDPTYNLS